MSLSATQHSTAKTLASVFSGILLSVALLWAGPAAAQDETTVSIESQSAEAGEAVDVPVDVTNFNGVGAFTLIINYDPAVLSFSSDNDSLITGAQRDFSANVPEEGELRVNFLDATGENPINFGDGTLLTLTPNEFAGGSSQLTFGGGSEIVDETAEPVGATFEGGTVSGDLSTLSVESVTDAGLNQTVSVPLSADSIQNVGAATIRLAYDESALQFEGVADNSDLNFQVESSSGVVSIDGFNAEGTTLAESFAEVQFAFLGGTSDLSFQSATEVADVSGNQIQTAFEAGTVSGDEPALSFGDVDVQPGDTASVSVQTSDLQELGSASVEVTFNAVSLTFVDTSEAIGGFNLSTGSPRTGVLRLEGFNPSGVNPSDNSSKLVDLRFAVSESFTPGSSVSIGFNPAQSELTNPSGTAYNANFEGGTVTSIDRQISLATQALDLTAGDTELQVTNVTAEAGDAILITTDDGDGEFTDETVVGARTADSELSGETLTVDVLGSTDTEDASPGDHAAHISTDGGFSGVVSTSQTAAIYGVAQFDWQDETIDGETSTVTIDAIEILYGGNVGPDTVSINLHEAPDGEITGSFVGVSQEDLPVGEVHENVAVDIIEPVSPSDENPQRTEDEISETGEFFAMAHLGPAGTGANGGRIPVGGSQQPPLTTTGTPPVIGDFATVGIGIAADISRGFPDASDPANYELVALPGNADVDLAQTLTGDQGPNWRAFREAGATGDSDSNLEAYDGSESFNFRGGRAFWVISQDSLTFEGLVPESNASEIPLQDGWNAISNPLRSDLNWQDVLDANDLDESLFRWTDEGSFEQVTTFGSAQSGEGYYVLNSAGIDALTLPSSSSSASSLAASESGPKTFKLEARSGEESLSDVTVGLGEETSAHRAPPSPFGTASAALRVLKPNSDAEYVRMVKPLKEESATFSLALRGVENTSVTLQASGLEANAPEGAVLVNRETDESYDLRETSQVTVSTGEDGEARFSLQVGASSEIAQTAVPEETQIRGNYPNPFAQRTSVELDLSERTDVKVQVYNLLGQQVATLADKQMEAGTHQLEWDGSSVSSGAYFVRMEAGGVTDVQKITVVR